MEEDTSLKYAIKMLLLFILEDMNGSFLAFLLVYKMWTF